jgi:hypothetical protein
MVRAPNIMDSLAPRIFKETRWLQDDNMSILDLDLEHCHLVLAALGFVF